MSKKPILGKGEYLVDSIQKTINMGPKSYPRTYEEGKKLVLSNLENLKEEIPKIPDSKRMDKVVIGIKLSEGFLAKSYEPNSLFREFNFEPVGTKYWETDSEKKAKMNYVKINPELLEKNVNILKTDAIRTKAFKNDIMKIEEMYLIDDTEVVKGFELEWTEGRVELVLHPFDDTDELISKLSDILGSSKEDFNIKRYEEGPIFISMKLDKEKLDIVKDFNPLRIVKPLTFGIRAESAIEEAIPNKNVILEGNNIIGKVGLIDGGIVKNHSFLQDYSNQSYEISSSKSLTFSDHGTKVAGVLMYGDLSEYVTKEVPSPKLIVESIRVLPTSDPEDIDMYEAIDLIEKVIPTLNDVKVFNISVGPNEPIDDDYISRFTYSLDKLAYEYKKLFVIAAGNDGDMDSPFNRVQVPADIANGLSVGAYSSDFEVAAYSSIGYGREGCLIKPELCEMGGPMLLLSTEDYSLDRKYGTSFSAPLVSRKAAEIMARSNEFNYLTTRALLIHTGGNEIEQINNYDGFGKCSEVLDILESTSDNVTIIYNNEMSVSSHAKIRIPLPMNTNAQKFKINWTIVVENKPNPLNAESYTSCGIEDAFYPNENKFKYTLPATDTERKTTTTKHIINDIEEIGSLIENGYIKSEYPVTKTSQTFLTEAERRALRKWDSVTKKSVSYTRHATFDNPFLIVHAMSRDLSVDRVRYSVVVSIEAFDNSRNKYTGDLYEEILQEYKVLQPIDISLENELSV